MPITNFEEITEELTQKERDLLPMFIIGFRTKTGPENSISNKQIVQRLKPRYPNITEVRVRKIINYIRTHNSLPGLIATSKGYYVSGDKEEIERYILSLSNRINEITRVKSSFEKYYKSL